LDAFAKCLLKSKPFGSPEQTIDDEVLLQVHGFRTLGSGQRDAAFNKLIVEQNNNNIDKKPEIIINKTTIK